MNERLDLIRLGRVRRAVSGVIRKAVFRLSPVPGTVASPILALLPLLAFPIPALLLVSCLDPALSSAARAEDAGVNRVDRDLLRQARAERETLWRRGFTLEEPAVERPLQELLNTLTSGRATDPAIRLKVVVFRSPDPNAFALPDGSIYVFAGLLGLLDSWDEVAFVLAHESEHAISCHAQKFISQAKTKVAVTEALSLGAAVALGSSTISGAGLINDFVQLGLGLAASASVNGYGRDLEREADRAGSHALREAGFDSCAAVDALSALLGGAKEESRLANVFWGNHPLTRDRIRDLREGAKSGCAPDSFPPAMSYRATKWTMKRLSVELWLKGEDYGHARSAASEYLAANPYDPEGHRLLGDAYGASASADTLRLAAEEYERALSLDGGLRPAFLGLARITEKEADTTAAIRWLEEYLAGDQPVPERRTMRRKLEFFRTRFPMVPDGSASAGADSATSPGPKEEKP